MLNEHTQQVILTRKVRKFKKNIKIALEHSLLLVIVELAFIALLLGYLARTGGIR